MKVLYLTNLSVPYRMSFFNELGKLCDLTVLVERKTASNRDDAWLSSIKNAHFNLIGLKSIKIGEESSLSFDVFKHLRNHYDIIVVGGYSTLTAMLAILYMKLHKIKFVLNADGGFANLQEKNIVRKIKTFFISAADSWITTSKDAVEYFKFYGAKSERTYIYPFTSISAKKLCKTSPLEKNTYKKTLGIDPDTHMLLTVGQIIPRKGLDILLNAICELDGKYALYIVGGAPTSELEKIIQSKAIQNVKFIDFLNEKELSAYYKATDAFVFPTRFDVWGLVVNEAMAYGLPVISSDAAGAAREMICDGQNGILFEKENVAALTANIRKLFADDTYRQQIADAAYQTAQAYTIEEMAKKHYDIFSIVKKHGELK